MHTKHLWISDDRETTNILQIALMLRREGGREREEGRERERGREGGREREEGRERERGREREGEIGR